MYDNIKTFNCFSFLGGAICFLFIEERYKNNSIKKQYIAIICVYLCFFQRKDRFWQAKDVFIISVRIGYN